ncbi:hypothetical protein OG883_45215 [Streptomyces sp. NBC_01142]|uniref:hypothetical protein n=1 Tax=Streptomyces sp. NBC_01142 TaxID=2975865 RepID=UPI002256549A|nr:hypothetical protein [Streptomyces sp. NBC_01142]MCX4826840.1 hypothetical protein [Streptomyces sp. NBC_01142]
MATVPTASRPVRMGLNQVPNQVEFAVQDRDAELEASRAANRELTTGIEPARMNLCVIFLRDWARSLVLPSP